MVKNLKKLYLMLMLTLVGWVLFLAIQIGMHLHSEGGHFPSLKAQPLPDLSQNLDTSNNSRLDGTLGGYDLAQIQVLLEKPCARWYDAFIAAGWEPSEWRTARWVMFRESRCDQYAWNGQDAGLMQINKVHRPLIESYSLVFPYDLFDPETNLWIAHVLWLQYGWKPWTFRGVVPE
jgi:hypothetical protein